MFGRYLDKIEPRSLCKRLGYNEKLMPKCLKKLEVLAKVENLYYFFKQCGFDFHLGARAFVIKLCKELGIEGSDEKIVEAKEYELRLQRQYPAYIFADTEFSRKGEPIFVLALMESVRRIGFDKEWLVKIPFDEQLMHVSQIVKEHYWQNGGKLPIWGEIKRYAYYYDYNEEPIVFSPDGKVISEPVHFSEAKATIKGKDMTTDQTKVIMIKI